MTVLSITKQTLQGAMKILICPDKFKGSLSAQEVCDFAEAGLKRRNAAVEVLKLPLADGGDGTIDILSSHLDLEPVILEVNDPLFRPTMATYYRKGSTAFIEMAMASGLQLLTSEERNPMHTSTYGTGELIVDAINNGATEVYLFVGGSSTNDAGIGMASALGYQFYDEYGENLGTTGECLGSVHDYQLVDPQVIDETVNFHVVTDVNNPFYGPQGAARMYAGQKGANEQEIKHLDQGLEKFANLVRQKQGVHLQAMAGSGAAGGLGGGAVVFLNARLASGIQTMLDLINFDTLLQEADYVITGEGKFDQQTIYGKVIAGVAERCQKWGKPLGVICGTTDLEQKDYAELGLDKVVSLTGRETSTKEAIRNAGNLVMERIQNFI